jgi:HEAT repeat protein
VDPVTLLGLVVWGSVLAIPLIDAATSRWRRQAERRRDGRLSLVRLFRAAGRELGLELLDSAPESGVSLRGRLEEAELSVACGPRPPESWTTTISASLDMPLLKEIRLRSRWRPKAATLYDSEHPGSSPVESGDSDFDSLIEVDGNSSLVHALLVHPVRRTLTSLARRGTVRLQEGCLAYQLLERLWSSGSLIALVREVLHATTGFPAVVGIPAALALVARTDPVPGVRARCLTALLAEHSGHPDAASALEAALTDPSDAVRVVAATALGERGVPVLREIATRPDSEESPVARSITLLGRRLSTTETLAILDAALKRKRPIVATAAIDALGRTGDAAACERLSGVLLARDDGLAVATANALGEVPSVAAEQALLSGLTARSPDVRHAVVLALAKVGTLETIPRLKTMLEITGRNLDLASALRQAIAAIQARLPGAAPGQVSLAEDDSGRLSLASGTSAGQVTIVPEERDPSGCATPR